MAEEKGGGGGVRGVLRAGLRRGGWSAGSLDGSRWRRRTGMARRGLVATAADLDARRWVEAGEEGSADGEWRCGKGRMGR